MGLSRLRIDPFSFALAVLGMITLAFLAARNGAAVVMCGLCLAAVLAARVAGFPNRALVPVVFGLAVVLWMVWIDPPAGPRKTSAIAHASGGALIGWALAETLRTRLRFPSWPWVALGGVVALTVLWEIAEWAADRLVETALIPYWRDSVEDIFFGALGAVVAIALSWLLARFGSRSTPREPWRPDQGGRG